MKLLNRMLMSCVESRTNDLKISKLLSFSLTVTCRAEIRVCVCRSDKYREGLWERESGSPQILPSGFDGRSEGGGNRFTFTRWNPLRCCHFLYGCFVPGSARVSSRLDRSIWPFALVPSPTTSFPSWLLSIWHLRLPNLHGGGTVHIKPHAMRTGKDLRIINEIQIINHRGH